ncbi:MAG: prepilin-type N-terminal cleavage/methylation domain-containing protein [Lentisphaerae bacterium]|jgi:general secretion pathway protein G|nr:prepilin-type N-terminal cleavage/methylation domain-containing protein [Lentisphaerota bacterium]
MRKTGVKTIKEARHLARSGFTLVELLLVVAILGILATVAIMNTAGMSDEARVSATRTSIAAIEQAARMYEVRTGKFPDSLEVLTQSMGERPALLDKKDLNDAWGTAFAYKKTGSFIEIRSAGSDGQMNTSDDLVNTETN